MSVVNGMTMPSAAENAMIVAFPGDARGAAWSRTPLTSAVSVVLTRLTSDP